PTVYGRRYTRRPSGVSSGLHFFQCCERDPVRSCTGILTGMIGRRGLGGVSLHLSKEHHVGESHDPSNESVRKRKKGGEGRESNGNGDGPHDAEEGRLRQLLDALTAAQHGEFDVRLPFT